MKKLLTILVALMMSVMLNAQTATAPSAGDGTAGNPYQIATLENLYWISQNPGVWYSHFIQTANIDASATSTWASGQGWQPIGYGSGGPDQFRGNYDGQNYTISGLYINRSGASTVGLFGSTYMANISNLGLVDVNITGDGKVGALVGQHDASSVITNSYSSGTVSGNTEVGGLVGYVFQQAEIHTSHSLATVTANSNSGGLAGSMSSGALISECYAIGSVTNLSSGSFAGGLVGSALVFSNIKNSYARGSVNAGESTGGLVGNISSSFVSYSYSTGLLTSGSSYKGGLVGQLQGSSEVVHSFWDITTSSLGTSSGGVGRTTAQMKEYATFFNDGWDYMDETTNGTDDFWGMNPTDNNGYPFLAWQGFVNQVTPVLSTLSAQDITGEAFTGRGNIIALGSGITQHGITWNTTGMPNVNTDPKTEEGATTQTGIFSSSISGLDAKTTYYFRAYAANAFGVSYGDEVMVTTILQGDGSVGNPYLIATWEDIQWIAGQPYNETVLSGHFRQVADIDGGGASMPSIGKRAIGSTSFTGVYDGNGHTISNVVISYPSETHMGFFSSINGGEVKRLGLVNFSVTGSNNVGALTSAANNAIITECYAIGVSVTGRNWVGGLIGSIGSNTIVSKCYTTGTVTGTGISTDNGEVGGLIGRLNDAEINNSYTHANVAGSSNYSGGFLGVIDGGTIVNCYSTGTVTLVGMFTSGFVGWDFANTVIGSFWDIESSNRLNSRVGVGLTTAEMTQYLTFAEAGWDLVLETDNGTDDIWGINPAENNGYPFLMWQGLTPEVTYPPSVTTLAASGITNDQATLNGNLGRVGIPSPSSHGFVWNTTGNPDMAVDVDNVVNLGASSSAGVFSYDLTGIGAISTYYYRAFVTTELGTFIGSVQTFKTVLEGSGTELDPYIIVSLSDLQWLMNNEVHWDKYFEQAADIDASLTAQWNSGAGSTPIGNSGTKFTGQYNGNGHSISGLYINRPTTDYQGLFGYIENALISNLNVLEVDIYANERVGIIAGHSDGSIISNCNTSGTINGFSRVGGIAGNIGLTSTVSDCISNALINSRATSISYGGGIVGSSTGTSTIQGSTFNGEYTGLTGDYHGGIVGFINGGSIINCESNATITTSGDRVGGIVGHATNMVEIRNCTASGSTQGIDNVGGLAGYMITNTPLLINSQSSGNVIGNNNVGGLVGALRATAKIENSWSNAHVTGASRVGGAVGEAKDLNVLVINSYSSGTVEGTTNIGGFVGAVETSAEVHASYSTATVVASNTHAGGFVGRVESLGKVFNSYALGSVTGASTVGGFAGGINNTGTEVTHCFAAGKTTGTTTTNIRGFAGQSYQATILYNLVDMETTGVTSEGGATGKTNTEMRTLSTYLDQGWDFIEEITNGTDDIWGINGSDNQGYAFLAWQGYGHSIPAIISTTAPQNILGTSAELHGDIIELNGHTLSQHGFTWNTTGNPNITDDASYNLGAPAGIGSFMYELTGLTPGTTYYARTFAVNSLGNIFYGNTIPFVSGPAGLGTELQPFLISNMDDYIWLINNPNHWDKHYLQTNDIDASVTGTWDGTSGSNPIGNATTSFTGVYDGNHFSITGLYIRRTSTTSIGMFGNISNAILKNITLVDLYMHGSSTVGGLLADGGTGINVIENCTTRGTVRGTTTIGGLAGIIAGSVTNCHFEGNINASNYVGGLIGAIQSCTVTKSSAEANITAGMGYAYAGGFAGTAVVDASIKESWANSVLNNTNIHQSNGIMGGFIGLNRGVVQNCYSMGSITTVFSPINIGGLIGQNVSAPSVSNSYSTVQIIGTGTSVGGAIGGSNVVVDGNLLWDVTTSGVETSAGGANVVGHTTAVMNDLNTYLAAGFDFLSESINGIEDIWGYNPEQNNSYPFFAWQEEFDHKYSPSITINNISDITSVSATINAEIDHLGESQPIEHGFYWNTTGNPGLTDNKISLGEPTATGTFNYLLTNLKPVEQYYIRAFFTDENDTYWGNEQSFNTPVKEIFFSGSFIANNKMYDGTTIADANTDNLVADGVVISASGVVIASIEFEFASSNTGNNITVIMSGVTLDGVDKDRYVVNLTGSPTALANITQKELTVSGAVADSKIYDGNTLTGISNAVLVGVVGTDLIEFDQLIGNFSDKNVGNSKSVTADITITGDLNGNYFLTQPLGLSANITAKELSVINAQAFSKEYDSTTDAVIADAALTGMIGTDEVTLQNHTIGTFTQANVGAEISVIADMTIDGLDAANYTIIQPDYLKADITPKPLTITASSFNKTIGTEFVFDGDEFFTSDIIDGDEVTSVTLTSDGAASAAAVGVYDIIPSNAVGIGLANYTVSYANGTLTVVDQTEVSLTGIIVSNKVYDGTTVAEITEWGTLIEFADGDDVTLDESNAVATFNNKNVGNNKVVSITGLALSGVDADKYYINNHFSNADITAKDLVLSGFYADDKVYDGDVLAINHGFDDDRIVDDVLLYSYDAAFEDKNAGDDKNVFFTGIEITDGADMNNYNLTVTSGSASASIFTREVIVLNAQALDKDYDGSTNAEVTNAELFNHIATDDVILEDHFFGFFAQANVGLSIPIETQMSLSGIDASNYDLIQPDYLVADISQKVLEVINAVANNKVYDATTDAEIVGAELSGVVSGDVVSLNNETIGEFAQAGVGVEINVTSFMMISGDDAGNYYLVQPALFAGITHKEITVGGSFVVSDKVYDGNNIAALNDNLLLIEGVIAPDAITIESVEIAFSNINVGDNILVNITNLTITGNTENYILSLDITPVAYANITPAQLTVINAIAQDKVYDGTAAAVITGAELAGVIGDDDVILGNNTVGTFTQVNVGVDLNVLSSMTISGADSDNYELIQPMLTASITAKPLTITAQSFLKSLGTEFVFEGDEFFVSEMILGDEVTSVTLTSDGAPIDAIEGDYVIIPSAAVGVGLENYDISYVNGTLSVVDQVELFISGLVVDDKIYDGTNIATVSEWGSLTPVADGDDVSLDFSSAAVTFANKLAENNKVVSITGLALSGANANNYFINNHSSQASITARTLVLSNFTADNKEYDGTTAVTGTSFEDDRVAADVLTFTYDAGFADKTAGQDKDVNYTNILIESGADMNNYVLGSTTGTAYADITQKVLTIAGSFTALDKEYDGTTTATIDENNLSLVGVITDDVVTLNAVAEFVSPIVANDIEVNLLSSTLNGTDALNYELSFVDAPTTTANITAPPVVYYTLTLVASPVAGGTVTGAGEYEAGEIVTITATPAVGYVFVSWSEEVAEALEATTTFTMPAEEVTLTAFFDEEVSVIEHEQHNISVYPNPFKNTININSLEGIASVKIINIIGQVITEIDVENFTTATINTRELPNGVYFISIKDSTGNTHTKKVVKE